MTRSGLFQTGTISAENHACEGRESQWLFFLNEKLERIRESINAVTEEPEDLHQLVLRIAGPGMLDTVFSQAESIPPEKLREWFDQQTGQMGGEDAVRVVQDLIGHAPMSLGECPN